MSETQAKQDARTAPVLVWDQLKDLSKDELASWRIDPVMNNRTPEERGINLPMPFGWFVVCYSDELAKGEVKPVTYFERELVVWRGEDGAPRVLDAYCPHLGAHLGYGGKVNGNDIQCPFHSWSWNGEGAATDIPYSKSIPPKMKKPACERAYPTRELSGFVW
ncbi:MAG: Rieske (2Fe-2S) protein, partial [Gammaproteobacteria bacterium]|nr:Rieske (2Fe-2S) protein [Gammaproteobacteria bacterium]